MTGVLRVLTLGLLLGAMTSPLAAQRSKRVSRFQAPAEERGVTADADAEEESRRGAARERLPENIETRLYLRERPDAVGVLAREFHDKMLESLLEDRERLLGVRRRKAVELLETFIAEEPEEAEEMPDALMRLAELRWEMARADYLEAFAAWQKVPERNRGREPRPDYSTAVRLYDRILDEHRDFPRYDLVLYMKAFALLEKNDGGGALALYRRILEDFPESRFVPDAHFAIAESHFTGSYDYRKALAAYERVLEYPKSDLADIALFKSAWCLWKLGKTREAATRFRRVLDLGERQDTMTEAQRRRIRELRDEALGYLIQVFTEDERNTASDVFEFLANIGGERYAKVVLKRLSGTYMGQARYDRAIEAYGLLLKMDPTVPEAPLYQYEIATAYNSAGDETKTFEALEELASKYASESTWARQQGDPEVVRRAQKKAERAIRNQALLYHEVGQRENQTRPLENAVRLYRVYLKYFKDEDPAYQVQFYLAEILFHRLERWGPAGEAYLAAARKDPKGEFTRDALYNAIGAFERVREAEIAECAEGGGETEGRAPTCAETENDRKFGEAIGLYVDLFPEDPDLPEILFRQGRLYHERGIFDPAVRLFGQLLARFPESEYAAPAGELILDSFNRARDYANIEKWARKLKEAPAFQFADKQKRLDGLILQSMFKVGEQLSEQGEHMEAANAYFRAAEEFPDDERAAKAYYNAGLMRQKAGDLSGAADAYDRLIDRHPGSKEGALGAWAAAQMYESIAQFRDAARFYEAYADKFPEGEKRVDALYNAVLLRVTAGDYGAAVQAGRRFLREYPRHGTVDDVYFFIGRAHEGAEDWTEAAKTYREYVRRSKNLDRKVEAQTRLGQVLVRAGDVDAANRAFGQAEKTAKRARGRLGDGLYYAAEARYAQGDLILAEYEAVAIEGPVEKLRKRLERKSQLLQKAALVYAAVVEYGVAEWVTAALFQIGRSYETFARAMRDAPIPAGLDATEEQAYRDGLAMFVIPMEERALEAYEGGYQKAIELRIFNRWTEKLREGLTRLNDVQYPPLWESGTGIVDETPLPLPEPLEALAPRAEKGEK